MARDDARLAGANGPKLLKGDEGGPLSRQLVGVSLKRLVDFLSRASSLRYTRASGLSDFEWRVLARVCETPDLSLGELAEHLHRGLAQTSRTVKRLVAMGLLRSRSRGGGPGVLISPAPLGRTLYQPMIALAREADRALVAGLSETEVEALRRCIEILTDNALAMLAHEQRLAQTEAETAPGGPSSAGPDPRRA
jgi:DNA-binding MarR family transcriptional regulator